MKFNNFNQAHGTCSYLLDKYNSVSLALTTITTITSSYIHSNGVSSILKWKKLLPNLQNSMTLIIKFHNRQHTGVSKCFMPLCSGGNTGLLGSLIVNLMICSENKFNNIFICVQSVVNLIRYLYIVKVITFWLFKIKYADILFVTKHYIHLIWQPPCKGTWYQCTVSIALLQ